MPATTQHTSLAALPPSQRLLLILLGGTGHFKDPDGHLFEVDYEDGWVLDHEHRLQIDGTKP